MKDRIYILSATIICLLASCSKVSVHGDGFMRGQEHRQDDASRVEISESRNVLLLYSAGYNSISSYLKEDIEDLQQGWIPGMGRNDNILLIYSHFPVKGSNYSVQSSPTLTRLWRDLDGNIVKDTLMVYPEDAHSATPEQLHEVLDFVHGNFPAKTYGMIFSSHATGYLPAGYYSNPKDYRFPEEGIMYRPGTGRRVSQSVPYMEPEHDPSMPAVKSIGQDQVGTSGNYHSYEIELNDFAAAIPMKLEYILFDACLMGGVEVAYELRDKCRHVGFSQTEVLAEGFDYKTLTSHLLGSDTPDPMAVCDDYFIQYDIQTGVYRSATISMVDCSQMEPLAELCSRLFEKYRDQIRLLKPGSIQKYFRYDYHWFYDLKDIIAKAGATEEELNELDEALGKCVAYKASTPEFMGSFKIGTYSGMSMYLPCNGSSELDKYYRTLSWNKATGLVL